MSRHFVNQFTDQETVDQVFLAADKQLRANRQGSHYIQVELSDRSGAIPTRMWNATEDTYRRFENGDYVRVRGSTAPFRWAECRQKMQASGPSAENVGAPVRRTVPASRARAAAGDRRLRASTCSGSTCARPTPPSAGLCRTVATWWRLARLPLSSAVQATNASELRRRRSVSPVPGLAVIVWVASPSSAGTRRRALLSTFRRVESGAVGVPRDRPRPTRPAGCWRWG